ncbi:hypothetical protein EVAR_49468_1 [Eumeta japonica]|uniref:Uncharacterized protein n=1 Tax=Eumeta variegata TaxID=151549 RepID=A0A4C1Y5P9_EUMVA|nr:hypothetical protein EVAR_49468_1 [Eumeta japonica]
MCIACIELDACKSVSRVRVGTQTYRGGVNYAQEIKIHPVKSQSHSRVSVSRRRPSSVTAFEAPAQCD